MSIDVDSLQMEYLVQNFGSVKFREDMLNGRKHLVVPMTMIVPGVLNGSKGALYYPPDEVGKDPTPWNGMPITVYHPVRNGKNVSARDPEVLDSQGIGVVLKARTDGKLKAEAWIDEEKANKVDPRVIFNIRKGHATEISTGLFTTNLPAPKDAHYNGKAYQWIARDYRPDHLAILPDQKGACSLNDGCGLGVNAFSPEARQARALEQRQKSGGHARELALMRSRALKATDAADAKEGTKRLGIHSDLHNRAAELHAKAAALHGDTKEGVEHAKLAQIHREAAAKIATAHAEKMEGTSDLKAHRDLHQKAMELYEKAGDKEMAQGHREAVQKLNEAMSPTKNSVIANNAPVKAVNPKEFKRAKLWITYNKGWTQKKRDALPEDDFAGPHQSFPIKSQKDVEDAARLIGHAEDPEAVKSRIKSIAKRKGFKVPKSWESATTNAMSESDHAKAAHRLTRHAVKLSKTSDSYNSAMQSMAEDAIDASKAREHDEAAGHHLKLSSAHMDAIDPDADEHETANHVAAAKAHQTAAASHYDVARIKATKPDDPVDDVDPEDVIENSYGNYVTSSGECRMKSEIANEHSELAEKTGREADHGKASRLHSEAALAYMSHEDGADTDKAANHSKKADEHAKKAGPGFVTYNESLPDGQGGSSSDVSVPTRSVGTNQEGENMAKLTAVQRAAIITELTSNSGCGCWKESDKEILQGFSDDRLSELKTNHEGHLATNSGGGAVKTLTMQEWMDNAPLEVQQIVANGAALMEKEKQSIITKLVTNMKDGSPEKTAMVTKLSAKTLDQVRELEEVAKLSAPPPVQNTRQLVFGPTGNTPQVVDNVKENDTDAVEMTPSRIDWKALANANGKPVFN